MSCAAASPEKRSSSEAGRRPVSTGGMNLAEHARQNGFAAKTLRHHARQRPTVRRLAPTSFESCRTRATVAPLCNDNC